MNVTAAAAPPAIDILRAPQNTFLLETMATVAPTKNNAVTLNIELYVIARLLVIKKYGAIGIMAPIENEKKELKLAPQGDPSCNGFSPNFSLTMVSKPVSGVAIMLRATVRETSFDKPLV